MTSRAMDPRAKIAAAWAALHYLGESGYEALAASSIGTNKGVFPGLTGIPAVSFKGNRHFGVFPPGPMVWA